MSRRLVCRGGYYAEDVAAGRRHVSRWLKFVRITSNSVAPSVCSQCISENFHLPALGLGAKG